MTWFIENGQNCVKGLFDASTIGFTNGILPKKLQLEDLLHYIERELSIRSGCLRKFTTFFKEHLKFSNDSG